MNKKILKTLFWTLCFSIAVSFGYIAKQDHNPSEFPLKGIQALAIDYHEHTMGDSLPDYLEKKIHHLLKQREFKNIWVIGDASRSSSLSLYEKKDKLFNWQRPTAEIHGDDILIKVFPGREYVKHYAALIASYFAIKGQESSHVRYILPEESQSWKALTSSNLNEAPVGDVAIIGWGLESIIGEKTIEWKGDGAFSWYIKKYGDKTAVFIGGRHSYWGDIGGKIVTLLAKKGFKQVIYIGKVGGMNLQGIPNQTLATGNSSFVDGEIIHWQNLFDFAKGQEDVVFGDHYTIPSVLNETCEWLNRNSSYAFVDNEIGFMAKAALSKSIQFSYLHIISDNLHRGYEEDLANERSEQSKAHRLALLERIKFLIENALQQESINDAAIDTGKKKIE